MRSRPEGQTLRKFESLLTGYEKLLEQAAAFATEIGPERLITITHSGGPFVVTVWYWTE
jgi:hypothetical protein